MCIINYIYIYICSSYTLSGKPSSKPSRDPRCTSIGMWKDTETESCCFHIWFLQVEAATKFEGNLGPSPFASHKEGAEKTKEAVE